MSQYLACTIVARNYLAQAGVLAASFIEHHPFEDFYTLVIDGDEQLASSEQGVGVVVLPEHLGIEPGLLHSMLMMYDVMELATALKPAMLMYLVRKGCRAAAYFDPDIRLYGEISDVLSSAAEVGVYLTPHTLYPVPRDGRYLTERTIMQAGIFNLGFICVGSSAYSFLSWWHERLQVDAIVDVENALFTDQRWIDWVPALFDHEVSRDSGLNAAYWNMHEREIVRHGDTVFAGRRPLRFFHFSGYDPSTPWLLSKHLGDRPRTLLSEHPALKRLCDEYGAELIASGHAEKRRSPYRLNELPNGLVISHSMRRFYRQLVMGTIDSPIASPDPFLSPEEFVAWLLLPMYGPATCLFSPAEYGIWLNRSDLRAAFPDVLGAHGPAFEQWLADDPTAQAEIHSVRRFASDTPRTDAVCQTGPLQRTAIGWSVVAYAASELGVGEAGRRMAGLMRSIGVPSDLVGVSVGPLSRQEHRSHRAVTDAVTHENAVICVNADQLPRVTDMLDLGSVKGRRVGLWFWELEEFPAHHLEALHLLDEVWVASEFTRAALARVADRPVRLVRLPIEIPRAATTFTRRSLGLPEDRFVFLANFDFLSVLQRKNPVGAINAYKKAFEPDDGAMLIVKSINATHRPLDYERMHRVAEDRPDIVFTDGYVTSDGMKAMIELADVYVSLHRAEGYGLNMADAMARGTPVVATGYSGNLEFMTADTCELVPYSLTAVGPEAAPYDPRAYWAEPDVVRAAELMRCLFDDRSRGAKLAARARQHLEAGFSRARAAKEATPLVLPQLQTVGGPV